MKNTLTATKIKYEHRVAKSNSNSSSKKRGWHQMKLSETDMVRYRDMLESKKSDYKTNDDELEPEDNFSNSTLP